MEKLSVVIILAVFCLFALVGCNKTEGVNPGTADGNDIEIEGPHVVGPHVVEIENEADYTGCWSHIESPDDYSVLVSWQSGNTIDLELSAVKDDGFQIATAEISSVQLTNGKGTFNFEDSFGNTGVCEISFADGSMDLKFDEVEYQWGFSVADGSGTYQKEDRIVCKSFPKEGDLIINSSFFATVPENRYGGNSSDFDYAPGEFLLWLSPMELTDDGYFIRKNSIAVPYIVSDDGNGENLSILSGGNDGLNPYGDSILYFTTDSAGEIIDVLHAEEVDFDNMKNTVSGNVNAHNGDKYVIDFCGQEDMYEGTKEHYIAGETVTLVYPYVATDTDYSFYVNSKPVKTSYDNKKGIVLSFTMPEHDVTVECQSANSMEPI